MMNEEVVEIDFARICFGLDRDTDERSLAAFLRLFSRDELLRTLIPRLADEDIMQLVDTVTGILRKHLEEEEYHELVLCEGRPAESSEAAGTLSKAQGCGK